MEATPSAVGVFSSSICQALSRLSSGDKSQRDLLVMRQAAILARIAIVESFLPALLHGSQKSAEPPSSKTNTSKQCNLPVTSCGGSDGGPLSSSTVTAADSQGLAACPERVVGNSTKERNDEPTTETRLGLILRANGCDVFSFKRVPADYYDRAMEERMVLLGAASVQHLCKSIVMVNTQAAEDVVDCSNPLNSKYYVVVVQYAARLHAEKVRSFIHSLNEGKISKKRFNMRLAPEEVSDELTGFTHNAVTPIGMRTPIPVILSHCIAGLEPPYFWLGGGEVDLKLGLSVQDFIRVVKPMICDCTY